MEWMQVIPLRRIHFRGPQWRNTGVHQDKLTAERKQASYMLGKLIVNRTDVPIQVGNFTHEAYHCMALLFYIYERDVHRP